MPGFYLFCTYFVGLCSERVMRYFSSKVATERHNGSSRQESTSQTEGSRLVTNIIDVPERHSNLVCGVGRDWLVPAFVVLIRLGDAVECYLPGVVTQRL